MGWISEDTMTGAVEAVVNLMAAYAAIGVAFAILFIAAGVHRVDTQAKGSGIAFRLMILPGVAALWPVLLSRWIRGRS